MHQHVSITDWLGAKLSYRVMPFLSLRCACCKRDREKTRQLRKLTSSQTPHSQPIHPAASHYSTCNSTGAQLHATEYFFVAAKEAEITSCIFIERHRILIRFVTIVTIRYDSLRFYNLVTMRYDFWSVSSDQVSPLSFLHYYILRAKSGLMKRVGIEISEAWYDSLRFYNFVTNRIVTIFPIHYYSLRLSIVWRHVHGKGLLSLKAQLNASRSKSIPNILLLIDYYAGMHISQLVCTVWHWSNRRKIP